VVKIAKILRIDLETKFLPDKAKEEFEKMPLKRQRWYRKDYKNRIRRKSGSTGMMP